MSQDINQLKRLLHLEDADSPRLLEAITHRSYAVENNLKYDNQRLEFLGDAVLEIILTEYIFNLYPDAPEGEMTKMRSAMVSEEALAKVAKSIQLGEFLRMGKGETEAHGKERNSTLSDMLEAVIGAIYLERGFEAVKKFVLDLITREFDDPKKLLTDLNPKGLLQEYSQKRWGIAPEYVILRSYGPEHLPLYEIEVFLKNFVAIGKAANRKQAESAAAKNLYNALTKIL